MEHFSDTESTRSHSAEIFMPAFAGLTFESSSTAAETATAVETAESHDREALDAPSESADAWVMSKVADLPRLRAFMEKSGRSLSRQTSPGDDPARKDLTDAHNTTPSSTEDQDERNVRRPVPGQMGPMAHQGVSTRFPSLPQKETWPQAQRKPVKPSPYKSTWTDHKDEAKELLAKMHKLYTEDEESFDRKPGHLRVWYHVMQVQAKLNSFCHSSGARKGHEFNYEGRSSALPWSHKGYFLEHEYRPYTGHLYFPLIDCDEVDHLLCEILERTPEPLQGWVLYAIDNGIERGNDFEVLREPSEMDYSNLCDGKGAYGNFYQRVPQPYWELAGQSEYEVMGHWMHLKTGKYTHYEIKDHKNAVQRYKGSVKGVSLSPWLERVRSIRHVDRPYGSTYGPLDVVIPMLDEILAKYNDVYRLDAALYEARVSCEENPADEEKKRKLEKETRRFEKKWRKYRVHEVSLKGNSVGEHESDDEDAAPTRSRKRRRLVEDEEGSEVGEEWDEGEVGDEEDVHEEDVHEEDVDEEYVDEEYVDEDEGEAEDETYMPHAGPSRATATASSRKTGRDAAPIAPQNTVGKTLPAAAPGKTTAAGSSVAGPQVPLTAGAQRVLQYRASMQQRLGDCTGRDSYVEYKMGVYGLDATMFERNIAKMLHGLPPRGRPSESNKKTQEWIAAAQRFADIKAGTIANPLDSDQMRQTRDRALADFAEYVEAFPEEFVKKRKKRRRGPRL